MFKSATRIPVILVILLVTVGFAGTVRGSLNIVGSTGLVPAITQTRDTPLFTSYKGVSIGMSTKEVRDKLGNPKEASDGMDYYAPSEAEYIQVYYDNSKVSAITVTFSGKLDGAPDCKAVFGEQAEVKPDGGIFKMVRYPKAGFWISYNKIIGDDPMIMIAIKKI